MRREAGTWRSPWRARCAPSVGVFGMDFCEPMLERAETRKARRPGRYSRVRVPASGTRSTSPSRRRAFDAVTIAFGLRNMSRPRALPVRDPARAAARGAPLRPRVLAALALRAPRSTRLYLHRVVPPLAGLLTGDRQRLRVPRRHHQRNSPGATPSRPSWPTPASRGVERQVDDAGRSSRSTRPCASPTSVEGLPAAAGRVRVRIADLEALAVEPVVKVDRRPVEVLEALRVHDDPRRPRSRTRRRPPSGSSNDIPYWSPEQPPLSTKRRRRAAGAAAPARIERTWSAALGVSRIMRAHYPA